jgi:hypothetical protein
MIANRAALEAISALAVKRRGGALVRYARAADADRATDPAGPTSGRPGPA